MSAKVSIIVPVYNIELYLQKCLDSILSQSFLDLQIIIVNDGSTDNSEGIIKNYAAKDDRILYLKKENGGLSDARNYGLNYVSGKYILFIDGDDYLDSKMVELLYKNAEENNSDIVECSYYQDFGTKLVLKSVAFTNIKEDITFGCCSVWNKLYKAELLQKSGVRFFKGVQYEDVNFNTKLLPFVNRKTSVSVPLYYYVQRQTSICHTYNEKLNDIYTVFDDIADFYKNNNFSNNYSEEREYLIIKDMLGGTYFRILKIPSKKLRNSMLQKNWEYLTTLYPDFKKNKYLKYKTKTNIFFILNKRNIFYKLFAFIDELYKILLLQGKFFITAFLNITKELLPWPVRNLYFAIFGIKVHCTSSIHRSCKLFHIGNLSIGKHSVVNFGCYLDNRRGISIGENTALAHDVKIYTLGHNINSSMFETKGAPVTIGNNCFIFSNVLIMPGVTIGDGAIVLPGSVVTKNVDRFVVVGGNPAKFIKKRNQNIDYKINYNYYFAL